MVRKMLAVLFVLLIGLSPRALSATVIQTPHVVALVDDAGREVISGSQIERVYAVRANALYAAGRPGSYQLYDAEGQQLNEMPFSMIADMGSALIFQRNGLYGAMSDGGATLIEPVWAQLTLVREGVFLALEGDVLDDLPDEILLLTLDGYMRATGIEVLNGLNPFSEDRMPCTASDGRCGYLNATGRVAVPTIWDYAGRFQDGVAIVSNRAGCVLIDTWGNARLTAGYDWMARGDGFIAALTANGRAEVYSADGKTLLYAVEGVEQVSVVGHYVSAQVGDETRLYDRSGKCIRAEAGNALFLEGLSDEVIVVNGAWGEACQHLIDGDGATLTQGFQGILPLANDRYAFMTVSGVEYYSGDLERLETSWDYDSLRYGLMDRTGRELLPARYREIRAAGEERLLLIDDAATTLTDLDGRPIRAWRAEDAAAIGE